MSAELFDVRGKVTALGHCALSAYSRAHDIDKSEIIRGLVEEWAQKQVHGATLLTACLKAKGIAAADQGASGNRGELAWKDDE